MISGEGLADFLARARFLRRGGGIVSQREAIENKEAAACGHLQNAIGDFVDGVFADFVAAADAKGASGAGEEQAQIIVNFGGGGDGGARIARGIFLADGDGRGDAGDFVHVGLLDAIEELAGVGGKRFDVAALAFGVERVEGEAGLARAGDAGDDGQGVVWNVEAEVLEIVDARAADADGVDGVGKRREGLRGRVGGLYRVRCHEAKLKIIR